MKKIAVVLAGIAGGLFTPDLASAQAGGIRIGYVNSAAVYQEAPGAAEAEQQFEQQMGVYRAEVQQLGEELQAMITQYEQQQGTLSPEAREAREAAIREKDGQYRQRVAELEAEAAQRQQELVEPVMRRINTAIEALRRDGGYALIFDVGPGTNIVAADPALDLTSEVLRRLRTEPPGGN